MGAKNGPSASDLVVARRMIAIHRQLRHPHRSICGWCLYPWPCGHRTWAEGVIEAHNARGAPAVLDLDLDDIHPDANATPNTDIDSGSSNGPDNSANDGEPRAASPRVNDPTTDPTANADLSVAADPDAKPAPDSRPETPPGLDDPG